MLGKAGKTDTWTWCRTIIIIM